MKAAVYTGKEKLELKTIAEPEFKTGGAIIKVTGCGLCGSDIVKLKQGLIQKNVILGHEVTGYIHKIEENKNFKPGDKVVLGHHVPCFNCVFCKNKNYSGCREFKASNIIPGGFCEYIYVSEKHLANTVFKIPENMPEIHASFTEPAACCLRAVKRASVKTGDVVFVIGLGSIGIIMGQILKHFGAKVIGCDLLDNRIKIAEELGFDAVYKYTNDQEISGIVKSNFQEEGADKVFLTAGNAGSIPLSIASVRDGGTILVFASVPAQSKGKPISSSLAGFGNNDIYYRELTVLGSYSPSPDDLKNSLNLIKDNIIKLDSLSTIYELHDINTAIKDTCLNKIIKAFIKINASSENFVKFRNLK